MRAPAFWVWLTSLGGTAPPRPIGGCVHAAISSPCLAGRPLRSEAAVSVGPGVSEMRAPLSLDARPEEARMDHLVASCLVF